MTTVGPFQLRIQLLGEFCIQAGERIAKGDQFRLRKAQNLVKILALAANHRMHRDQLSEMLWPDQESERAANNLHQAAFAARQVFDSIGLTSQVILQFNGEFLCLSPNWPLWIDVEAFETAATHARLSQDSNAYQSALSLYSGDLLPEDLYEDWASNRREILRQENIRLLLELGGLSEAGQNYQESIAYFQKAVAAEPACEEAHAGLMRLYANNRQRSAALAQYEACRQLLMSELGAEPSPQTTALYQQIMGGKLAGPETGIITTSSRLSKSFQSNLPAWLFPFIGRIDLIGEIRKRIKSPDCRLLSLTGPGGSGKTRLAVEAAKGLEDSFPDGVCFIPLAGVQSTLSLVPALAQALNFSFYEQHDPSLQLFDYLRDKTMLLVIDNFEHLLEGAGIVADILGNATDVKILVTSRVRLNLIGESLLPVFGLELPEETQDGLAHALQTSGVQLFIQGAQRVLPSFMPTPNELEHIARICRLVQGMPLSILLASTWMRLLSPVEIAEQIDTHNLDILESDWADIPARQKSLRAVFNHSWSLLSNREQTFFAGLSVFRGGFTFAAAQQVCGVSLRDLKKLVDHSLIQLTSIGRYQVHELLRQFGEEKLKELPYTGLDIYDRHTHFFIALLNRFGLETKSARQLDAEQVMKLEIENAQTAWMQAVEQHQLERLKEGMEGLGFFYIRQVRYADGELAFHQAVDSCETVMGSQRLEQTGLLSNLWAWHIRFHQLMGDSQYGQEQLKRNLETLADAEHADMDVRREKAFSLMVMGLNRDDEARSRLTKSLAFYRELGACWEESFVLLSLGLLAQYKGNNRESLQYIQESLEINRALSLPLETNETLRSYAWILSIMGQTEEGDRIISECILQCRLFGDQSGLAEGLYIQSWNLGQSGKYAEMFAPLEECAAIYARIGNRKELARTYHVLGKAHAGVGQYEEATAFFQKSMPLFSETAYMWGTGVVSLRYGELALAQDRNHQASQLIRESLTAFKAVNSQAMIGQALPMLVIAESKMGELNMARQHLLEALRLAIGLQDIQTTIYTLISAVQYMAQSNSSELAIELYSLALCFPFIARSVLFQEMVGKSILTLSTTLPPEVVQAAEERGRMRDLERSVAELLEKL